MTSIFKILFIFLFLSSTNTFFVLADEVSDPVSSIDDNLPETLKEKKSKEGYVVNLKDLVEKSKKKIEQVNDKLQDEAKRRRNMLREEKAREYYEKAMRLNDDGKYPEAQEYFKKAIEITEHPEMNGYIHESIRRSKRKDTALRQEEERRMARLEIERGYSAKEVEKTYDVGVSLFKQKKYLESKDEFDKVDEMFPDHKATRSYLMVIQQEIQKDQQKSIDDRLRQEVASKRAEKEIWRKQLEVKEKDRQQKIEEQAETIYQQALKFYKIRQYQQAKDKFKEVEWIIPDYRSTGDYLARIDGDIRDEEKNKLEEQKLSKIREEKDAIQEKLNVQKREELKSKMQEAAEKNKLRQKSDEAEFVYNAAVLLFKKDLFVDAKQRFDEVEKLSPNFKDTAKYLQKINEASNKDFASEIKKDKQSKTSKELKKVSTDQITANRKIDDTKKEAAKNYRDGIDLYKRGLFKIASEKFQDTEKIFPNYKKTHEYLEKLGIIVEAPLEEKVIGNKKVENTIEKLRDDGSDQENKVSDESLNAQAKIKVVDAAEKSSSALDSRETQKIYDQAVKLFKQKKTTLAKQKFEEVNSRAPHFRSTDQYLRDVNLQISQVNRNLDNSKIKSQDIVIDQAVKDRRAKFQSEAEKKYAEAMVFYKSRNFVEAKRKLIQVEAIFPDFQETAKYLSQIDTDIDQALRPNISEDTESTRKSWFRHNNESGASPEFTEVVEKFKQAVILYNENNLNAAQDMFNDVESASPGYKTTRKYLKSIEKKLANLGSQEITNSKPVKIVKGDFERSFDREAKIIYADAVRLFRSQKYEESKGRFTDLEQISPEFKDTQKFLNILNQKITEQKILDDQKSEKTLTKDSRIQANPGEIYLDEKNKNLKAEKLKELESIYRDAVALFKSKRYDESREKFEAIASDEPNYKKTSYYLSDIKNKQLALRYAPQEKMISSSKPAEASNKLTEKEENDRFLNRSLTKEKLIKETTINTGTKLSKESIAKAISAYKDAVTLYESAKYIDAKQHFLEIKEAYGNFKKTQKYLDLIAVKMLSQDGASTILALEGQDGLERALRDQERVAELKAMEGEKELRQNEAFKLYKKKITDQERLMEDAGSERINITKSRAAALQNKLREQKRQQMIKTKQSAAQEKVLFKEKLKQQKLLANKKQTTVDFVDKVQSDTSDNLNLSDNVQDEEDTRKIEILSKQENHVVKSFVQEAVSQDFSGKNMGTLLPGGVQQSKIVDKSRDGIQEESLARLELKQLKYDQNKLEKRKKRVVLHEESTIRKKMNRKEIEQRKRWTNEIDDMYGDAIHYFRQKRYRAAKIKFSAIENMYPGYKEAKKYMDDSEVLANSLNEYEEMVVRKDKAEQARLKQIEEKKENDAKLFHERIAAKARKEADLKIKKEEAVKIKTEKENERKKAQVDLLNKRLEEKNNKINQQKIQQEEILKKRNEQESHIKAEKENKLVKPVELKENLGKSVDVFKSVSNGKEESLIKSDSVLKITQEDVKSRKILLAEKKRKELEISRQKKELANLQRKIAVQGKKISTNQHSPEIMRESSKENIEEIVKTLEKNVKKSELLSNTNNSKLAKADQEKIRLIEIKNTRDLAFQKRKDALDRRLNKVMLQELKNNYSIHEKNLDASIKRQPIGLMKDEQRQIEFNRKEELQLLEKRIKKEERRIANEISKSKHQILPIVSPLSITKATKINKTDKANKTKPLICPVTTNAICPVKISPKQIVPNIKPLSKNTAIGDLDESKTEVGNFRNNPSEESSVDRQSNVIRGDLDNLVKNQRIQLAKERERLRLEFNDRLEQLYQKALTFYKSGSFVTASKLFYDIESLSPGYKKTKNFIEEIKRPRVDENNKLFVNQTKDPKIQKDRNYLVAEALDAVQHSN